MLAHNKEVSERNNTREERQVLSLAMKRDDTDKVQI